MTSVLLQTFFIAAINVTKSNDLMKEVLENIFHRLYIIPKIRRWNKSSLTTRFLIVEMLSKHLFFCFSSLVVISKIKYFSQEFLSFKFNFPLNWEKKLEKKRMKSIISFLFWYRIPIISIRKMFCFCLVASFSVVISPQPPFTPSMNLMFFFDLFSVVFQFDFN